MPACADVRPGRAGGPSSAAARGRRGSGCDGAVAAVARAARRASADRRGPRCATLRSSVRCSAWASSASSACSSPAASCRSPSGLLPIAQVFLPVGERLAVLGELVCRSSSASCFFSSSSVARSMACCCCSWLTGSSSAAIRAGLASSASCGRTMMSRLSPARMTVPTLVPRSALAMAWPTSAWVKPSVGGLGGFTSTSSTGRWSLRSLVTSVSPGVVLRVFSTWSAAVRRRPRSSPVTVIADVVAGAGVDRPADLHLAGVGQLGERRLQLGQRRRYASSLVRLTNIEAWLLPHLADGGQVAP